MSTASHRVPPARFILALALVGTADFVRLLAAESTTNVVETREAEMIEADLKSLEDPTVLKRRIWLDTEWSRYDDDSNNLEETLGFLWAWRLSRIQEWAVRLKMPYVWHLAGDQPGDSDDNGFGDLKVATGTAFRLSEDWRTGVGVELRMPTAERELGDDVWKIQEFGTVAWDATSWLTFSPTVEYNQSISEQSGAEPQHYAEFYFPATWLMPDRWSFAARYEAKVDFEHDNDLIQSAKFTLTKQFAGPPVALSLSFKKPFEGSKDFQFNFVVTYFFKSNRNGN